MLVGHNTLRLMVMGMANRPPTADELRQMIALLEEALDAGALGLSSGLFTAPGSYAQPDEMIALCRVVKRHNAGYFTHLRDESNKVLDALAEAIEIAEQCRVHVEIVHFKCSGTDNWGKARQALETITAAKARGLDVDCDSYPYAAGSNPLKNLMPQWVQAGGVEAMLARLKVPETRARIRTDIARDGLNNWGRIRHGTACRSRFRPTCRNMPAARSARSRTSAGKTRSTRSPTTWSTTRARPACW
jgi:N-acyl-D-amino-acid deacylase